MKILVAGGAGYVGSALVPKLLERGYEVDIIDLLWFGNRLPGEVAVKQKDIMDLEPEELVGYDQVIFLAGLSNDPMADFAPGINFASNGAAPAFLAYLAKRAGVRRYIYGSTCSVYGYTVNELYDERSPAVSHYAYGISKLQGERGCLQIQDDDFSVISLRQGTICGYSPRMRLDLVVNTMFKTAFLDGRIVVNNPAIWRPILSIEDAVAAYVRSVEAHFDISGVFNVASGNYTIGELADYVKEVLDAELGKDIELEIKNVQDLRNYKVSIDKAMRVLSFKPKHDVESIVRGLLANLESFSDFDNPLYYNIETFKTLQRGAGGRLARATA